MEKFVPKIVVSVKFFSEKLKETAELVKVLLKETIFTDKNRIKEEDSIRKQDTAIAVAQIQQETQMNSADEIASENRARLLDLEQQKAQNDAILKARKQDETERSNREKESIAKKKITEQVKSKSNNSNKNK